MSSRDKARFTKAEDELIRCHYKSFVPAGTTAEALHTRKDVVFKRQAELKLTRSAKQVLQKEEDALDKLNKAHQKAIDKLKPKHHTSTLEILCYGFTVFMVLFLGFAHVKADMQIKQLEMQLEQLETQGCEV